MSRFYQYSENIIKFDRFSIPSFVTKTEFIIKCYADKVFVFLVFT